MSLKAANPTLPVGFHWLQVADIKKETAHACSVSFTVPQELQNQFRFEAGQYLTLLKEIDGEQLRRPYSLCVDPATEELRICAKLIPNGRMSSYINRELRVGDQLAVMQPDGRFFNEMNPQARNHYVGIAGGSGITPVIALLSAILQVEADSVFTLLYGNRTAADIIFRERLSDLKNRYLGRLQVIHVLSEEQTEVPLFHGLLDAKRIGALMGRLIEPMEIATYFICGPGPMMEAAKSALRELDVENSKIKIESFGSASGAQAGTLSSFDQIDDATPRASVVIKKAGQQTAIAVPTTHSILDAALAAKLDLPFACKGGVCCTCKAKLIEGSVSMAVNYGLEPDEVKAGFILTCQAKPQSDSLIVDYDV